jgi:hypothetical protein
MPKPEKKPLHRPQKYGEETVPVVTRVPKSKVELFKKLIQPILNRWIKKH